MEAWDRVCGAEPISHFDPYRGVMKPAGFKPISEVNHGSCGKFQKKEADPSA